jgi:integrase/recombinase XerD
MQLSNAIDSYLLNSQIENKTPKTIRSIQWELDQFAHWKGDVALDVIETAILREYLFFHQQRGLSGYSVHDKFKVLRAFFRWCLREELLTRDPTQHITPPKLPQLLPKVLSPQQIEGLIKRLKKDKSIIGRRNLTVILTLLDCGLRVSELADLTTDDVHLEESYILVRSGKGQKQRIVPVSPNLHRYLARYLSEWRGSLNPCDSSLFVGREGKHLQVVAVQHLVRRALKGVGVTGGPHLLRHSCATLYLRNGGDLERLRLLLGHSDLTVLQRYTHLLPEDLIKSHERISPLSVLHV